MSFERELGAREAVERIVRMTKAFADKAGAGELEYAGGIISYLAAHQEDVERLLKGFWSVSQLPAGWQAEGRLDWRGKSDWQIGARQTSANDLDAHSSPIPAPAQSQLASCPFCGESNRVKTATYREAWFGVVQCLTCGATAHGQKAAEFDAALESACQAWNRRAP